MATNNALLLLSRLYEYDRGLFENVLIERLSQNISVGVSFRQQTRSNTKTVPDGMFWQPAFKVVLETKLDASWRPEQIKGHLNALQANEGVRVLLLLSTEPLESKIQEAVDEIVNEAGKGIIWNALTFGELITSIRSTLRERDFEMEDILEDFEDYAAEANLLPKSKSRLRVVPCGVTWEANEKMGLYYEPAERGAAPHAYLGIYADRCVRLIGKVSKFKVARVRNISTKPLVESSEDLSLDEKKAIIEAWHDAENHGWVEQAPRRFTFVEQFYHTSFKKSSPGGMRKHRNFDLKDGNLLGTNFKDGMDAGLVAERLSGLSWE